MTDFTTWPKIAPQYCNGSKQSPINIVTASVQGNPNLTSFNFTGFDDNSTFMSIVNTGESGKHDRSKDQINVIYYDILCPDSWTLYVHCLHSAGQTG